MINTYDPFKAPDPKEWIALDEKERVDLVLDYHFRAEEEIPNAYFHSTIHAVIEYQIALGNEYPVRETLHRLMREGLNRHEAIHAIGSVLIKYIWEVGTGENASEDFTDDYFEEVHQFTAQKWFDEFG